MRELLRKLAAFEPGDLPLLSVYLDVRPEGTPERPAVRAGLVVLEDRLREIRRTYLPRGPQLDSFDADAARIQSFVANEMARSTEGLALFACAGRGINEVVEVEVPFEDQVSVGPLPDLYQLARLDDEYETAVVAVVDTNTARIFVYRYGKLIEDAGLDDDPAHYQKRRMGGWSQARYQRHIDNHRRDFTGETGRVLARVVEREDAQHVILAGDPPSITPLLEQMPRTAAEKIRHVAQLDLRANRNEVLREIEPIMREVEAASGATAVDRVVGEVRRGGLGASGVDAVRAALDNAQVDQLILDDTAEFGGDLREALVRDAIAKDAGVEVVSGSSPLLALGGVAALLRYRLPAA